MNTDTLKFLQLFGESFWLQTFDDKKSDKTLVCDWWIGCSQSGDEGRNLAFKEIKELNEQFAGAYFCVNGLKKYGPRKAENIEWITSFFVDLDGAPLQPVLDCKLKPNVIVQTSADRWHAYWIMDDYVKADRRLFKTLQRNIAERFNGDKSVTDLCRVMRLPGFYNMKNEPFMVHWDLINIEDSGYNLEEIENEFGTFDRPSTVHSLLHLPPQEVIPDWVDLDRLAADAGRGNVKAAFAELDFDAARLRGALLAIDLGSNHPTGIPDEYETWVRVMIALKSAANKPDAELTEAEAFEYWITWSDLAGGLDHSIAEAKWQSAEVRGEIDLRSVFYEAKQKGYLGERRNFWNVSEMKNYIANKKED